MKDITLDELKRLIATAQSEKAIQDLLDISKYRKSEYNIDNQTSKEILLLSSRFKLISSKHRQGVISDTDFNLEVNKINAALVQIIEKVESRIYNLESSDKKLRRMLKGLGAIVLILMLVIAGILFKDVFNESNNEKIANAEQEAIGIVQVENPSVLSNNSRDDQIVNEVPESNVEKSNQQAEVDAEKAELKAELEKAKIEKQEADAIAEKAKLQAELEKTKREKAAVEAETEKARLLAQQAAVSSPATTNKENGVDVFVKNHQRYIMDVGIGSGSVQSVSYDKRSGNLTIRYNYKNGKAEGRVDEYGYYEGRYSTGSSNGSFSMRFNEDGTSTGEWRASFLSNSFSLRKK